MAVKDHEGPLENKFPIENRLLPQGGWWLRVVSDVLNLRVAGWHAKGNAKGSGSGTDGMPPAAARHAVPCAALHCLHLLEGMRGKGMQAQQRPVHVKPAGSGAPAERLATVLFMFLVRTPQPACQVPRSSRRTCSSGGRRPTGPGWQTSTCCSTWPASPTLTSPRCASGLASRSSVAHCCCNLRLVFLACVCCCCELQLAAGAAAAAAAAAARIGDTQAPSFSLIHPCCCSPLAAHPCVQVSVLADAVHNKQAVPEGFQLIIDSMAGL